MADYRIFFLDDRGSIIARDEFSADFDGAAVVVSDGLFDACSDHFGGYELWSGSRRVTSVGSEAVSLWRGASPNEISQSIQLVIAERERVLLDSGWTIARSTRLLAEAKKLHELLNLSVPAPRPK